MSEKNSTNESTRHRILVAACEVFAENGFRNTTVREICRKAEVNVAAVNYHFGSKENLYAAVWEYAHMEAVQKRVDEFDQAKEASSEKRLLLFIKSLMENILNPDRPEWDFRIVAHEMIEPTGAFDKIVQRMIRPGFLFLRDLVQEILGEDVPLEKVERCSLSIVGQCLYYRFANPVVRQILPGQTFDKKGLEELACHITEFSLFALKKIRSEIENEEIK